MIEGEAEGAVHHFQRGELAAKEPFAGGIHHEVTKQALTRKLVRLLN